MVEATQAKKKISLVNLPRRILFFFFFFFFFFSLGKKIKDLFGSLATRRGPKLQSKQDRLIEMEKENEEEEPSKSDKQEILILPPHWDDEDTELYEQFPHEFSIIRQFLDELVAKKQREEEWRSGFHQFCTLTHRWCELYKAEMSLSPKSYKAGLLPKNDEDYF
ncbi:hypothetical protein Syun_002712 [Stephania yunnanensis]|uniref:Uncharacterized protein n=1 Tax=Stephania yunnanensis TaxID=152371 RepID=A0AAP0Q7E4_9MAGN